MIRLLEVVATALDAAQHRRERLLALRSATTPTTPATPDSCRGSAIGMKRKDFKKDNPSSASTAASASSVKPVEKVTPDAKQIRTEGGPAPKSLFTSPPGDMDVDEGRGFSKSIGDSFTQKKITNRMGFEIQSL